MVTKKYKPDRWITLEIRNGNIILHKILAGWKTKWQLSSGITQIIDKDDYYEIHNKSGSIYLCNKKEQGVDGLADVLTADSFTKVTDGIEIDFISLDKKCRWED